MDQFLPTPQPVPVATTTAATTAGGTATTTGAAGSTPPSPIPPLNPATPTNQPPTLKDLDDKITGAKRNYVNVVREAQRMYKEIEDSMAPKKHLLDKFHEEFKYLKSILDQHLQKAGITETGAIATPTSQNQATEQRAQSKEDIAHAPSTPNKEGATSSINQSPSVQWSHRDSEEMGLRQRLANIRHALKTLSGSRRSRKRRERSRIRAKLRKLMAGGS
jgi:hypothetical protein